MTALIKVSISIEESELSLNVPPQSIPYSPAIILLTPTDMSLRRVILVGTY